MSTAAPAALRRIVIAHSDQGVGIAQSDSLLTSESMEDVPGATSATIWVTEDSIPTNDNNCLIDGADRKIVIDANLGLVHPNGTNLRSTELAPGVITPMHRTTSLDYNILVQGELMLICEDGTESHLKNPGDTVIQKGCMHAWRNPSTEWSRWITVLIAAEPAIVQGKFLEPAWT